MYQRGSSAFAAGAAPILPPDAYFFTVHSAGEQVGVASITVDTLTDGVKITQRLGLDLPIQTDGSRSQFNSEYIIGMDLGIRSFTITVPGRDSEPVVQHGTIEGDSLTLTPGTGEPRLRFAVGTAPLIPPLAAPVAMALQHRLRRGEQLDLPVYDPAALAIDTISLRVLDDSTFLVPDSAEVDPSSRRWVSVHADTLRAWKLAWSGRNHTDLMWVDSRGLPIRIIDPAGLELDRSAFEIVTINYRRQKRAQPGTRSAGIVPRSTIASAVAPAGNITGMRVRLLAGDQPWPVRSELDSSSSQHMEGDTVVTAQAVVDTTASPGLPVADPRLAPWLAPEPLLDPVDTAIATQARSILGDEKNSAKAAERLVDWVSRTIERVPDPTVRRAQTVLRIRQANADGHTLLFVALARAAGLPARPVSGILLAGERFYLHSWAEVFLGEWVAADPTWGGFPATADRIRFATGALSRPMDLLPLLAGLDVQMITLTRHP